MRRKKQEYIDPRTFLKCSKKEYTASCVISLHEDLRDTEWQIYPDAIAHGTTANIFSVVLRIARKKQKDHLLKYLPNRKRIDIDNEICMQNEASAIGLAPEIVDWWICDESFTEDAARAIIIMKRAGSISFGEYIVDLMKLKGRGYANFVRTTQLYKIMFDTFCMAYKLNTAGILHNDLNLGNIMIRYSKTEPDLVDRIYFIDYGIATRVTDVTRQLFNLCERRSETDAISEIADAISKAQKLLNADRLLTVILLIDVMKMQQASEQTNPYFMPIFQSVIRVFYDNFMLGKMTNTNQDTWSNDSYEAYRKNVKFQVVSDILDLAADGYDTEFADVDFEDFGKILTKFK